MWNRQREAAEAREKLAQVEDEAVALNRDPPPVEGEAAEPPEVAIERADAAE
jgi:ATP-binding cassette subfamily B protein